MSAEGGESKEWVAVQKKTFTKWVNNHLKKGGFPQLGVLENEFTDGINLMNIVHALYKIPFPKYTKVPKLNPQKFDNISQALQMVTDAKIKTNFLKTNHLFDKDLKMILGMIWSIILDYAIKGINVEDSTAKEGLLIWCRKKTAGYRDIDPPGINNFTRDWKNGLAFCALIHRHRPDLLDYSKLDAKNNNENLELAFAVAEKDLGIPRLLDVADMATPDERSVMTYVSEYFHRFAQQGVKELAARRVAKFLQFAKGMIIQQSEYEKRAKALLEWVKGSNDQFTEYKWGDTLESAKEAQAFLRNFVVSDAPPKQAERLDLETLFAEIQTELKVNDRAPYKPPEGLSPEAIEGAFAALGETQRKFGESVRVNRFKYITKQETKLSEEKINEFKESFAHFDANKNGHLDRTEFKAACTTMNVPFKDEKAFDETFVKVAEGGSTVNQDQYIRFLTELQEDRDTPEQVKASFKMMADEKDSIAAQQLLVPPLNQEDVEFLSTQMPKNEDGSLNYGAFVDANFVKNS